MQRRKSVDGRVHRNAKLGDSWKRHLFNAIAGISLGALAYGTHGLVHFIISSFYAYYLLRWMKGKFRTSDTIPSRWVPMSIFVVSMTHLSFCHIYRQLYNAHNSVDLSGPMMVIAVKVIQFGWNVWDGLLQDCVLTPEQRKYAIHPDEFPSFLEFLGFIFYFPAFLTGPALEYKEYDSWINQRFPDDDHPSKEHGDFEISFRSTWIPSLQRLFVSLFFAAFHILCLAYFPTDFFRSDEFTSFPTSFPSFIYKLLYIYVSIEGFKSKFYFVWLISEGASVAMGFGVNRKQSETNSWWVSTKLNNHLTVKWDGLCNVDAWKIETSTSFQTMSRHWNHRTHHWLKQYVYFRVIDLARDLTPVKEDNDVVVSQVATFPKDKIKHQHAKASSAWVSFATVMVYLCSAFWHGFYPGYYLTFLSAAILTIVERMMRKNVWPNIFYALSIALPGKAPIGKDAHHLSPIALFICEALGWFTMHFSLYYIAIPFAILDLHESLMAWKGVYFTFHIIFLIGFVSGSVMKPPRTIKSE